MSAPQAPTEDDHAVKPKLRFITNNGPPNPKRRRVTAACLTCRKRKTGCSGERPFCETCRQNKVECTGYSPHGSHGNQANGHKRMKSEDGTKQATRTEDARSDQRRQPRVCPSDSQPLLDRLALPLTASSNSSSARPSAGLGATRAEVRSEEESASRQESLFSGPRNRMPYFRWLGPTAIMPGFKQMVVKIKRQSVSAISSTEGGGMLSSPQIDPTLHHPRAASIYRATPAPLISNARTPLEIPFYDTSAMPPGELITHLCNTFFVHLGCTFPFLQRERFLRDLEEKQVDAILVDAVCALAARFSTHTLLARQTGDDDETAPSDYGQAFAHRAKVALVDTYACPTVAATQAALLLAYNEFGEDRDSGLWMYLGIAIRFAQDLGMHKPEGLQYAGRNGPTPRMVKLGQTGKRPEPKRRSVDANENYAEVRTQAVEEQEAVERERTDTFWAVFFLDRAISVGTGRVSTIRDKDIELSFPPLDETHDKSEWPNPFPALIRIIHYNGRVADLLNSLKEPADITAETPKRLATMEYQVTSFYQGLSPRLHFDAINFQHYVKAGEGTNFVLLHFWFHTLIMLLHQPTLLLSFEPRMLQLFPNSQQLSMSSAKTIADILSYSQLIDTKASLGNPFTTQPIYVAACAFLKETAEQTASSNVHSRAGSPVRTQVNGGSTTAEAPTRSGEGTPPNAKRTETSNSSSNGTRTPIFLSEQRSLAKHTLLATAASQHYQLCYKALKSLEYYWAGTKYILTVLDQKFKGVGDPLLYTVEEGESAMERPKPEPAFTEPGWRRKVECAPCFASSGITSGLPMGSPLLRDNTLRQLSGSPSLKPSQAIGWTLTGMMNSPSTNLAWHYPTSGTGPGPPSASSAAAPVSRMSTHSSHHLYASYAPQILRTSSSAAYAAITDEPVRPSAHPYRPSVERVPTSDADLLLGLASPFHHDSPHPAGQQSYQRLPLPQSPLPSSTTQVFEAGHDTSSNQFPCFDDTVAPFGNMMIESQDIDMHLLGLDMPWFEYLPTDSLHFFEGNGNEEMGPPPAQLPQQDVSDQGRPP
ncbi:hypothetical protein LTR66_010643 [Elasticomyces elasticus]|nr:hypothetical protein LTR66_010643 [Elasticomyces elasticus]